MKLLYISIVILLFLSSCKSSEKESSSKPVIHIDKIVEAEGFLDLPFTIVSQERIGEYYENKIQAINQGDTLELVVKLKKNIPSNLFLEAGIIFESTGTKSDKLFRVLAEKYGLAQNDLRIKEKQVFTCANLNQGTVDFKSGTARFKVFMEDQSQNAELYVNFDFLNSQIFLAEKDPDYRIPLISLMKK